jgi:iron complex transport system permease protein
MAKHKPQTHSTLALNQIIAIKLPWFFNAMVSSCRSKFSSMQSLLLFLLLGGIVVSAGMGAMYIAPAQVGAILLSKFGLSLGIPYETQQEAVLWAIRLPRVLLGVCIGGTLGISGAAIQGLFRNPLADPGLIGISSGASLFAVMGIVIQSTFLPVLGAWLGFYLLPFFAFTGAALTAFLIFHLSRVRGQVLVHQLLLVGLAFNALAGAIIGLMIFLATDAQLRSITFWSLGSLGGATWESLGLLAPFGFISLFGLLRLAKPLNLLTLGENQAANLGVNIKRLRWQVVCFATLAVGAAVALAGIIGFIGLIVPHLIRLLGGSDHRKVLLGSATGGAFALTLADTLARTVVAPAELPVGIVTALLGAPLFLYLLLQSKKAFR